MSLAYYCQACSGDAHWRIERRGDAAVTWSCWIDLGRVCLDMQRDHEHTELVITLTDPS